MELTNLKGVGKTRLTAMHAAGIFSLRDLLYTVPIKYRDVSNCMQVENAKIGMQAAFHLRRSEAPKLTRFGKMCKVSCRLEDDTGSITAVWFNQPWRKESLMKDSHYLIFGRVDGFGGKLQLSNPSIESAERIVPLYRPIDGLPQKTHETLVRQALEQAEIHCAEWLSARIREEHELMGSVEAIRALHAPTSMEAVAAARRRLAFEQMLAYQAAVRLVKNKRRRGIPLRTSEDMQTAYWNSLPFEPTQAQRRTLAEAARDMAGETAMTRMVQGDVGCGKTAVALGAIWLCAQYGYQAAMMAPTEILARQHYHTLKPYLKSRGISCGLLVGGLPAAERREALKSVADGTWQVVIGTHALISKRVVYARLGLCITDEQHRFGVGQRTALLNKGRQDHGVELIFPHLLVMSATPIPRSLALVMFGDLDISIIDELPSGRLPVTTCLVPENKREGMYGFLRKELEAGQRVYIVCPLIEQSEETEGEELKAARTHGEALRQGALAGFSLGILHGKQTPTEKEAIIGSFASGEMQVLVSTTVVEVGVNVPSATVMVIEDADRYGLAQLHQLRGRVGRGSQKSWCFLLAQENERLRALVDTNDGFVIAKKDLELRGPGEILGTAQHGLSDGRAGLALMGDMTLLYETAACAEALESDPSRSEEWRELCERAQSYMLRLSETVSMN